MKKFEPFAASRTNPHWNTMIKRELPLYPRVGDLRTPFGRDYTRIIHSTAYRRLKHKTQVFFSPANDHICTRIEHVTHVESISYTISQALGLNGELTKAIAVSHDLGHSPFGHAGEYILSDLSKTYLGIPFWHEKNGLTFVDNIELLEDVDMGKQNLNLTYAVRDGIISHCGEIDENSLRPREEAIDLLTYEFPNQFSPYTWEACVVKISDKISYLCRDIEDAITLGVIPADSPELATILSSNQLIQAMNNTNMIHALISDLCEHSSPENGLCFSAQALHLMDELKKFNYTYIYHSSRIMPSTHYFDLVLREIFEVLKNAYEGVQTLSRLKELTCIYPLLGNSFSKFLLNYVDCADREARKLKNRILFSWENEADYLRMIICYISGMTDHFAMEIYHEIIHF